MISDIAKKHVTRFAAAGCLIVLLEIFLVGVSPETRADPIDSVVQSPIFRALHPDTSTDVRTVTFHFGEHTFNVPRNYLTGGSDTPQPNEPGFFRIWVLLPDLTPRTANNADKFTEAGHGDKLVATLHYETHAAREAALQQDDYIKRILELGKKDPNDFEITPSGYRLYHIEKSAIPGDFYIKTGEGRPFYMWCIIDGSVPYPSCSVREPIKSNFFIEYAFSKKYHDDGYNIDTRIRNLLSSFEKN